MNSANGVVDNHDEADFRAFEPKTPFNFASAVRIELASIRREIVGDPAFAKRHGRRVVAVEDDPLAFTTRLRKFRACHGSEGSHDNLTWPTPS